MPDNYDPYEEIAQDILDMKPGEVRQVFVYGTLKSGGPVRGMEGSENAQIVGRATTLYPDYDMIDMGQFPAVVMNGTYKIQGEVWEVNAKVAAKLDAIEGYPDFYKREQVQTTQGKAWMYYLERDSWVGMKTDAESPQIDVINDEAKQWIL
jgi:gamma-glutamylcyclotransferase (GGCT)/AIG2-like uncharacterized protein YtfP|tara:strand:- start:31475 stop:31927 length:453 start_codon:yes stop_codon:yes gene_type:complete